MVRRVNLNDSAVVRNERRLSYVENASPQNSASVDRGAFTVRSEEGLVVEGSASVTGTLKGDGNLNWVGPESHKGTETHEGAITNTGTLTNNGATKLNGATEVNGDLTVTSPGKIAITGGSSPATLQNGKVTFGTGGSVESIAQGVQIKDTQGASVIAAGGAASMEAAAYWFRLMTTGAFLNAPLTLANAPTIKRANANNAVAGTAFFGSGGVIHRVVN